MTKNEIVLGLVRGRHDLPVDEYVFEEITDPGNFGRLLGDINKRLFPMFDFFPGTTRYVNQIGEGEVNVIKADKALRVYVTGFSPALAALINWCYCRGVELTLMHWSPQDSQYLPQKMSWR